MFQIIEKEKLNEQMIRMTVEAPFIAKKAQAGQFIILRIDEHGERIPLTIADYDREAGTVTIIFQKVGKTTYALDELNEGDSILDFVGPLGVPTELGGYRKAAVIGGGAGCAIAYPQAKALHAMGADVTMIAGFRNKDLIILEEEMKAVSSRLIMMTDDGSNGNKGFVTNALQSEINAGAGYDLVIAIGPLPAEQLKKQVACCTRSEFEGVMEVRGHSWETNLPARRIIYTRDLYEPVQELAARIANAARNVLESTPPELAADVSGTGILLTGGGSLLRGLAGYIAGELHTDVAIAPDPLNCVARGTAISLSEGKYLSAGFRDATPKVWNRRLNHSHDPFTGE